MKPRLFALVAATVVSVASFSSVTARASYVGPWDAAANEAAERAVARLGPNRALAIRASVLVVLVER